VRRGSGEKGDERPGSDLREKRLISANLESEGA
jgi:hypothetical protein